MSAPQQPNPQETLDNIVAHYLKKKGYARAEQVFREEARVQSIEALAANAHLLADLNVANYVMFYNPAEQHPRIYNDSYRELRKWVDQSLDMFQPELIAILYPIFIHSYLDLVEKGHTQAALAYMEAHKSEFMPEHADEILRIQSVVTQDHMKENELVKTWRKNKLVVKMSSYAFELLLAFLQDQNFMTLLSIINQYVSISVFSGQPQKSVEYRPITGETQQQLSNTNKEAVRWGVLKVTEELNRRAAELNDEGQVSDAMDVDEFDGGDDEGKKKKRERQAEKKAKAAAKKKKKEFEVDKVEEDLPVSVPTLRDDTQLQIIEDLKARVALSRDSLPSVCFYTFFNTHSSMNSLALSPDGSVVAAGFSDSSVKMWDMLGGRSKLRAVGKQWQTSDGRDKHYQSVQVQRENEEYSELVAHSQPVYGLSFSPDNKFLLSSSADGTVRLWSSEGRTNLVAYRGHNYPVWDVKFSPFGYYFVTASSDRTARLWTTSNPFPVRIFAGHLSDVNTVDFHPNCNYIISGSIDKCARMWDVNSGNCVRIFTGHSASLYSSCVSKDGRLAFTGGDDKDIIAWDLASSKRVGVLKGHTGTIWSLDVSGEGSLLASGSADNTVRLWDLRMLRSPEPSDADKSPLVATYHTKNTPVYKVAFTQRNLLLAGGPFRPPNPAE